MAYCYNLISCNPEAYPTLNNRCSDVLLDDDGENIFVYGNPWEWVYTLEYQGMECDCEGIVPPYGVVPSCTPFSSIVQAQNCITLEIKNFGFVAPLDWEAATIRLNDDCSCWKILGEGDTVDILINDLLDYDQLDTSCKPCINSIGGADFSERTYTYAVKVKLPNPPPPDRGFEECCYKNIVLASQSLTDDWANDYNSFWGLKQLPDDEITFILIDSDNNEYNLNDDTYGAFWGFGGFTEQPDLTVIRVNWKNVLSLLGEGVYRVKKTTIIAGIPFDEFYPTFILEEFTHNRADKTVRMDCVMNGELVHLGVDFKGTNFATTLRMGGYFGNRSPKYTQDNLVKRSYKVVQVSMSSEDEYEFQTHLLPECITEQIYDFHLFADEIFISDYNKANHSYKYLRFGVEFNGNKGEKYYVNSRVSRVHLTFKERIRNKRKINC